MTCLLGDGHDHVTRARGPRRWRRQTGKVTKANALGDDAIWAVGDYTRIGSDGGRIGGRYSEALIRDGDAWFIRMLMGNLVPSQDPTGMSGASAASTGGGKRGRRAVPKGGERPIGIGGRGRAWAA